MKLILLMHHMQHAWILYTFIHLPQKPKSIMYADMSLHYRHTLIECVSLYANKVNLINAMFTAALGLITRISRCDI